MTAATDFSITLLSPSSPSSLIDATLSFATEVWRQLYSYRLPSPPTLPADLANFHDFYLLPPSSSVTGSFLVAHRRDKIIGILGYRPYIPRFPDLDQQWAGKKLVEVVRLFVDPNERGHGVAKRLIEALVARAEEDDANLDGMYLHTHPVLPGARTVWEKSGWTFLKQDEEEKDRDWDTIHMIRWLR